MQNEECSIKKGEGEGPVFFKHVNVIRNKHRIVWDERTQKQHDHKMQKLALDWILQHGTP